jgi:acyl dehydratase
MKASDISPGLELPPVSHLVTKRNILRYGGVVGAFNPEHEEDDFAQEVGFGEIFAHGVMHLNYVTQMLCDFAGHPGRLKKLEIDFGAPVYSGEVVTARGVVREAIREGDVLRVTCEVWSEKQDGTRVTDNGTAELEIEEYQPRP